MSKGLKVVILIVGIVTVMIGLFFLSKMGSVKKVEYKEFIDVNSYEQFMELYNSKEKASIIYIGRPTCSYCIKLSPVLKSVSTENNLDVYYINTDGIDSTEFAKINAADKFLSEGSWGTPLIMIVGDGEMKTYVNNGTLSNKELTDFFVTAGVLENE
ncbi:MAG TPA: conjugal transfer protein TraF [Bacilli bacterium]|nr:conjugal transfer protein TraF [Bacilli bacterium]